MYIFVISGLCVYWTGVDQLEEESFRGLVLLAQECHDCLNLLFEFDAMKLEILEWPHLRVGGAGCAS